MSDLWYKDAIFYELHVKAFQDGNGDGVGDFGGLVERLDYIQDLGVTCLWLLPFYPSPLRDDGYDIADYYDVAAAYGTMPDFEAFLREAHRRGLRVIADLVVNHTSDQHPWFQEARKDPRSAMRDYYVWNADDKKYRDARIIFVDTERSNWTWDPIANAYYWHRFFSHQPDLNYDNPAVQQAMLDAMTFWLDKGLDGFRCDAVPYLFEREGTSCENLPETHAYLRELRRVVDAPELSSLLLTFGVSIALVNVAQLAFTSDLRSVEYLTGSFVVGPFALSKPRLAACAFAIVITVASFVFLRATRLGKAIRAVSQSREVAQVCGIDVQRIHLLAFGLGSALAAAGGSLVAVMVAIQPEMGQVYTFKSFLVIVLGGAGNYPGALLGGLLLGLVEQLSSLFLTTQVNEAVAYVLLVLVLLIRPTGLLKGRV